MFWETPAEPQQTPAAEDTPLKNSDNVEGATAPEMVPEPTDTPVDFWGKTGSFFQVPSSL